MKILFVHTGMLKGEKASPTDLWRISRPLNELRKHVDWDITERPTVLLETKNKSETITDEELEATAKELGQYDIIYGTYTSFMNPSVFTLCMVVEKRYGTKIVIDVDDDVFSINPDNIGWWLKVGHEETYNLQQIIRNVHFLTTTNERLAKVLHEHNPDAHIAVVENYISSDYKVDDFKNDRLRIGYFGGASHFYDLHKSSFIDGLRKLMHENKNIEFISCGIPIEDYLPKQRYIYHSGMRGHKWLEVINRLKIDIAVAPLLDNPFSNAKSDIKWQESSMMGCPLIASNVSPYKETIRSGVDGILTANDASEWYKHLKDLVDNPDKRATIAKNAKERVIKERLIENNWSYLQKSLELINTYKAQPVSQLLQLES